MPYVVKRKQTRTHYRVEWNELDGPKSKAGFTTRDAAVAWCDKHVVDEGFGDGRVRAYQARKINDKWQQ